MEPRSGHQLDGKVTTSVAPSRPALPPHDHTPRPYSGPSKQEVLAIRKQYCHPSTFLYYRDPLMLVEGHMQYVYDETGRRYLDFFAGIVTVSCGHSHPEVREARPGPGGGASSTRRRSTCIPTSR